MSHSTWDYVICICIGVKLFSVGGKVGLSLEWAGVRWGCWVSWGGWGVPCLHVLLLSFPARFQTCVSLYLSIDPPIQHCVNTNPTQVPTQRIAACHIGRILFLNGKLPGNTSPWKRILISMLGIYFICEVKAPWVLIKLFESLIFCKIVTFGLD